MFELALPWVLTFLPVPILIWFFLPSASLFLPGALKIPFFNAMVEIVKHEKQSFVRHKKIGLFFLIWFLVLFALSGPRWVGEPRPLAREGYNIMLVLDLSGSMELPDMMLHGRPASRLTVVKRAAEQFVRERIGDKIGLILFGSRAYLQTPLTYDRQNILMRLEDATVGLAGKTTSIGDALGLAVKRLQNVPEKGRMIILLTDGANNSGVLVPMKAAELARADDIKIYTIGLGAETDPRALGGLFFNMNASADLDEETLQEVAKVTGGRYFRATDMQSLQTIYEVINQLEKVSQEQATVRPQHDYYPWPLALAFFVFLYWLAEEGRFFARFKFAWRERASP
ncbi:VWA domain-containing protein [Legionella nagasakiensis]|uniref:VWA domain-containing protein n=1 Tax=Legionella nagasakiensis TaxID=535290 RepID=UPI0010549AC5|nr:VWA domain-containing protein [Legionella nagasakiensis]